MLIRQFKSYPGWLLLPVLLIALFMVACNTSEPEPEGVENEVAIPATAEKIAVIENPATLPPPVIVESTHTPPPATNTPLPTDTPAPTEVPPTETPVPPPPTNIPAPVQPANTAVPPTAPPPTEPPPPPPPPIGANGLVASKFIIQDRSDFTAGQRTWFEFTVDNTTGGEVSYHSLGVMPRRDGVDVPQWYQRSYGGRNSTISPGGFSWEDNIKMPERGNFTLRLVVCFDSFESCGNMSGTFHSLSPEIPVTIN